MILKKERNENMEELIQKIKSKNEKLGELLTEAKKKGKELEHTSLEYLLSEVKDEMIFDERVLSLVFQQAPLDVWKVFFKSMEKFGTIPGSSNFYYAFENRCKASDIMQLINTCNDAEEFEEEIDSLIFETANVVDSKKEEKDNQKENESSREKQHEVTEISRRDSNHAAVNKETEGKEKNQREEKKAAYLEEKNENLYSEAFYKIMNVTMDEDFDKDMSMEKLLPLLVKAGEVQQKMKKHIKELRNLADVQMGIINRQKDKISYLQEENRKNREQEQIANQEVKKLQKKYEDLRAKISTLTELTTDHIRIEG